MTDPKQTLKTAISTFDSALAELTDRLQRATERASRLEAQLEQTTARMARGTADLTADVATAATPAPVSAPRRARRSVSPPPVVETAAPAPARDPAAELETALREKPRSVAELARAVGQPAGHVSIAMRALKKAGRVYNIGTSDAPRWTWVIGDETSQPELAAAVTALIRDRPMTFGELMAATGARRGRVSGVIVGLQRGGAGIENRGDPRRARWFLPR